MKRRIINQAQREDVRDNKKSYQWLKNRTVFLEVLELFLLIRTSTFSYVVDQQLNYIKVPFVHHLI